MSWGERVWCKRRRGGVAYSTLFFTQLVVAGLRPIVLKGTEGGEMKGSFLPQAVGTRMGVKTYSPLQMESKPMRVS